MAFNIGDVFSADLRPKGAIRTLITEIELHLIDPNPLNFYSMDGIDSLAESIRNFGLMEPLIVKTAEGGHYMLISGHRRREALRKLAEEGFFPDGFHHKVDCILHDGPVNLPGIESLEKLEAAQKLWEQLQLIAANADTRVMSSADKATEIRETRKLYDELEELGYKVPGRKRDRVAETAKISASRVARLEVIDKNLVEPTLRKAWEAGHLQETSAYEIARRDPEIQKLAEKRVGKQALCGMKTENVIICLDGCEADGNRKRPEPEKRSAADTKPAAPAAENPGLSAEEKYEAFREASQIEDDILRDICRRNVGDIINTVMRHREHDFSTDFRLPNIDAMKKHGNHSYSIEWRGDGEDIQWDSKGIDVRKQVVKDDGRSWVRFRRSWTDFYDALSGAAMEQVRKKQTPPKVSAADTGSNWLSGKPKTRGDYVVIYGVGKEYAPEFRSVRIMRWDGTDWVNPKTQVHNLEGMTVFRWAKMPEV